MENQLFGLVLTGGGARGAYQAGALLALSEMTHRNRVPFNVLAGSSAGAINVAYLASRADAYRAATRELVDLWGSIQPSSVFRTDLPVLAQNALQWAADLGLGGWGGIERVRALLDTAPLRGLIESHFDAEAIKHHLHAGRIRSVAISATNYESGQGVTFFDGDSAITPWERSTRRAVRTDLKADHVMASAAIPIFFPPVPVEGGWYADGSVRLHTPLSPAIHMGATRILAIAVRDAAARPLPSAAGPMGVPPSLAFTTGLLLNALFLDALESDLERVVRINQTVSHIPDSVRASSATPLHNVDVLVLRPSIDPATLVLRTLDRFPKSVRHMFRGLGASETSGWELLSYLGFESSYTTRLLDLGFADTMARSDEIVAFLNGR